MLLWVLVTLGGGEIKMIVLTLPHLRDSPWGKYKPLIPLGLGFLASMLEKHGHEVKIIDNYLNSYYSGHFEPTHRRQEDSLSASWTFLWPSRSQRLGWTQERQQLHATIGLRVD